MANKRINDLVLRSDFDATCTLPVDDASQSWRVTGAQIYNYILATLLAAGYPYSRVAKGNADSPYTLVRSVSHLDVSTASGAVTVTIPSAASGNAGQTVWIRKTSDDFTAITLSGGLSTKLHTEGECIQIQSNGSAWVIINRTIPSVWKTYSPGVNGHGSATFSGPNGRYKRIGDSVQIHISAVVGTAGSGGSNVSFDLPTGLETDTADLPSSTYAANAPGIVVKSDSTNPTYASKDGTSNLGRILTVYAGSQLGSGQSIIMNALVPIVDWNG